VSFSGSTRLSALQLCDGLPLTQEREITPYVWVHPDEERCAPCTRISVDSA